MILTGIKPTGTFHLGNYISTIKPILNEDSLILIADLHALINNNPYYNNIEELYRIFLSFGLNNIILQSDIPEISELNWILSCFTELGFLTRSHAYKVKKEENINKNKDEHKGINAGLFNYPVLMTADNIIFDTEYVSIGKDQVQHIEIAKDITNKINNHLNYDFFKVPIPIVSDNLILGYDGQKMSKSYNNIIPLFLKEKQLKKEIFKMKTNSKNIDEPKYFNESPICDLFKVIATDDQISFLKKQMEDGIGWGDVKKNVFYELNEQIKLARLKYDVYQNFNLTELKRKCNMSFINETKTKCKQKISELKDRLKYNIT